MLPAPLYDATIPNIVGSWGLRLLVSTYSGPLIRISDGIGGSQQDVGFDVDGNLDTFTVSGTPYLIKVYDQSGNGCDLSVSGNVELVLGITPRGGPACKLTGIGVGGTVIYDASPSTSRPYLTANQVWIMGVGMSSPNGAYGTVAQIPHAAGANASPFLRSGLSFNATDDFDFNVWVNTTPTNYFPEGMTRQTGWMTLAIDFKQGKIIPGIKDARVQAFTGGTVSYPNATGIYIGGSGDLVGDGGHYFCELTIIDDGAAVEADLKDAIYANQSALFMPQGTAYRIKSIENFNGDNNESLLAEWAWALTSGGSDLTNSLSPTFCSAVDITNSHYCHFLVDNGLALAQTYTTGFTGGATAYYGQAFDSPQAIAELKLTASPSFFNVTPKIFDIEYLDDDGDWQFLQNVDLTSQGVSALQVYTIVVSALPVGGTPTITSVSPSIGPIAGGQSVTIIGTNLTGTTDVQFDGTSATSIVVVDDTHITCVTPAHAAGAVDVDIFNPAGDDTLTAGYTYSATALQVTQVPLLVLDYSEQQMRVTQTPILILYQEKQPNRVTQVPALVLYTPKPVPLPKPVIPETPLYESWEWLTAMNASQQGQEQRGRLREVPRYKLEMSAVIRDEPERVSIYNMLMRYLKTTFLYPMFQYGTEITALAEIGDTKIFADTSLSDLRDGEIIALLDTQSDTINYVEIDTVDGDGVNLVSPLEFDVPTYWQIAPATKFRITPNVGIIMKNIEGALSLVMESTEPRVFQRPGAAPTLISIDGILIVPERPLANEDVPEGFDFGTTWFDNGTSIPDNLNEWSNPKPTGKKAYNFVRKTGIDYWRAVCDVLKGRQGVALFPTFRNDLPLRADVALNVTVFTTNNIDFFIWWLDLTYRYIMIMTANGPKYRQVIDVSPHYNANGDPDYVTVTLASSIGNTAGDNVISSISYMNLYRLDDDSVKLTHDDIETLIELPLRAVDK